MKQTINLLNGLPDVKHIFLPCLEIRKYCLSFLVLLLIYSGYVYWQDSRLGDKFASLQQQQMAKIKQLTTVSNKLPASLRATDTSLNKLTAEINHHEKLIEILKSRKNINSTGFSDILTGLAQNITPNTWLTEFKISKNGEKIDLTGKSHTPTQIFKFLNNLDDAKNFSTVQFKIHELESITEKNGNVVHTFNMGTVDA